MSTQPTFTMEQMLELMDRQAQRNQENLLLAIQELKKRSPEEQEKFDKEQAKTRERIANAAKLAMAEEKAKANRAKYCPHGTTHPGTKAFTHQWRAQIHTPDGEKPWFCPTCTQCGTPWNALFNLPSGKIMATTDQLQNGINLDQYGQQDIDKLFEWAKYHPIEELQAA